MNKQELIKSYEAACFAITSVSTVLEDLKQLDEPQKVTIPQFVADYIDFKKTYDFLYGAVRGIEDHHDKRVQEWFYEGNIETFVRAWLDGYEVEKDKRYLVKVKGHIHENILVYGYGVKRYFFSSSLEGNRRAKHTRKELEQAGFGWVFDCPGMEVEGGAR